MRDLLKIIVVWVSLFNISCATTGPAQETEEQTETAAVVMWCVAFGIFGIECDDQEN